MSRRRLKVFFDGGCRPNPGPIEVAVVMRGTAHLFTDLGQGGNEDAEWLALIRALELAQASGEAEVELIGDSREVVRRADAVLRTGQAYGAHSAAFRALAAKGAPARVRWIRRGQNLAGIALAARHPR